MAGFIISHYLPYQHCCLSVGMQLTLFLSPKLPKHCSQCEGESLALPASAGFRARNIVPNSYFCLRRKAAVKQYVTANLQGNYFICTIMRVWICTIHEEEFHFWIWRVYLSCRIASSTRMASTITSPSQSSYFLSTGRGCFTSTQ